MARPCGAKEPRQLVPIFRSASKHFKGLSIPDLPRDVQALVLTWITKGAQVADGDCSMRVRCKNLALMRRLSPNLAWALLSKLCLTAFLAESIKRNQWRAASTRNALTLQLSNFFNRDVVISMLMKTFTNAGVHSRANGQAAFKCLKIMFKIQDVENRWYHECLEAMQNNQRLPIFRPAESEEWKDLQQSLGLRDVINAP
jgi:hypothetical protein